MAEPSEKNSSNTLAGVGRYLTISTNMVAAIIFGYAAGHYLDKWLGTDPWLTVVFFLLGVATGIKMTYDEVIGREERAKRASAEHKEDQK